MKTKSTAHRASHSSRKTNNGHTLLELLAVLSIIAILSGIALNNIQQQWERYALKQDTKLLLHTIETAKNLAILSQTPQEVLANNQTITLNNNHYPLSGKTRITLARFPKTTDPSITFTSTGHTDSQNGTFTLTSTHGHQTKIIINQGGRVYIPQ